MSQQQETPLAAVALQNPVPQSSIELAQTARGLTQVAVKVYSVDIEAAKAHAVALYDELTSRYAPKEAQP